MANIKDCPLFDSGECCGSKHLEKLRRLQSRRIALKTVNGKELVIPREVYGETWQTRHGWYSKRHEPGILTDFLATEGFSQLDERSQAIVYSMHPGGAIYTPLDRNCPNLNPTHDGHEDNPSNPPF